MRTGTCIRCERVGAVHAHHVTLRGNDGDYLHPTFTVDLCPPDHLALHAALRAAGLDRSVGVTPFVVMARTVTFMGWLASPWPGRPETITVTAELISTLAGVWEEELRGLESSFDASATQF